MLDRSCRTLEFSDGSEVTADAEHRWPVTGLDGSRRIITTRVLERALERGKSVRCWGGERGRTRQNMLNRPKPRDESRFGRSST
jgi:hypothetical protein